jgi:hypothetical protein
MPPGRLSSTGNLLAWPLEPGRAIPSVDEIKGAGAERLFTNVTAAGMTIQFEETTLGDVKEAFGGEIQTAGDAGTSSYWLCYLTGTDAQRSILWFVADGEMGGSDHTLNTIAVEPHPGSGVAEGCASAPASLNALAFDIPGVGSTLSDVTAKFGLQARTAKGIFTMRVCSRMLP